jgi:hypothetical protein
MHWAAWAAHHWSMGVLGLTMQAPLLSHIWSSPHAVPQGWSSQSPGGSSQLPALLAVTHWPSLLQAQGTSGHSMSGGQAQLSPQANPAQGLGTQVPQHTAASLPSQVTQSKKWVVQASP